MQRLLLIEDHKKLVRSLQRGLTAAGYEVVAAESGEAGFYYASTQPFDAMVLDLLLPGKSGLEILSDLRNAGFAAPVLILSALDTVPDRVRGLDQGADDYLVKPFAFEELLARLRALLNRPYPGRRMVLTADDLELHVPTRKVLRDHCEIPLSRQEYRLLEYLLRHKNTTVTRESIAREAWNEPQGVSTNVVDVYINALRRKLERPHLHKLLRTVRGVGYALCEASSGPPETTTAPRSPPQSPRARAAGRSRGVDRSATPSSEQNR